MIDRFSGQYRFLSNFEPCVVHYDDLAYPSVEHAYQASKTTNHGERLNIWRCFRAGEAKKLGKQVTLRPGFDDMKVNIMRELLREKFSNPDLKKLLKDTGSEELVEGNDWGDVFWGVCDGRGQNWLGKLLMEIRATL
jgi:N-glycosidase YbiA